jgi:S-adenosylmethionine:tRNA ribosyltransferase-isomerase
MKKTFLKFNTIHFGIFVKKSDFNYILPAHLIAQCPLPQRTASRLLCMKRESGELHDGQFSDLLTLINQNDLIVFNNTRVIAARLFGQKATGGKVEMLIERILDSQTATVHIKASKAPQASTIITLEKNYVCQVIGKDNGLYTVVFEHKTSVLDILDDIGHIPLPPYIERISTAEDLNRYQTVFAESSGAVAAPTAGLHFDDQILEHFKQKGIQTAFVTLHVGSGTFQPVRVDDLHTHTMHKEYFCVSEETVRAVERAKANGGRIIAIGTTVVRALESASVSGKLNASSGETGLFILPGYKFKSVDALLTNFHLPESTLLMLVSAFSNYAHVMHAYQYAIKQQYRFFSYGDAMWIA